MYGMRPVPAVKGSGTRNETILTKLSLLGKKNKIDMTPNALPLRYPSFLPPYSSLTGLGNFPWLTYQLAAWDEKTKQKCILKKTKKSQLFDTLVSVVQKWFPSSEMSYMWGRGRSPYQLVKKQTKKTELKRSLRKTG